MKLILLKLILIFAATASQFARAAAVEQYNLEELRQHSLTFVKEALAKQPNRIYNQVYEVLAKVQISKPPSGYDFGACYPNGALDSKKLVRRTRGAIAAFFYEIPAHVYACGNIHDGFTQNIQALIHEAAHLVYKHPTIVYDPSQWLRNECEAVQVEYSIMIDADAAVSPSALETRCGLTGRSRKIFPK